MIGLLAVLSSTSMVASSRAPVAVIGATGSCDGAKTCLDCIVDVAGVSVDTDPSETRLLAQIGLFKPNRILSCCHTAAEVSKGRVSAVK